MPRGTSSRRSSALTYLPEERDTREQALDLRLALRSALLPSGDAERILAALREAEALAAALDDPSSAGTHLGLSVRPVPQYGCV